MEGFIFVAARLDRLTPRQDAYLNWGCAAALGVFAITALCSYRGSKNVVLTTDVAKEALDQKNNNRENSSSNVTEVVERITSDPTTPELLARIEILQGML